MANPVPSIDFLQGALTVSYQYVGKCAVLPAPFVDLYCPHECHYEHDKIEDHETGPGHRQTLVRTISPKNEWLITRKYPRHALPIGSKERWVSERLDLTDWDHERPVEQPRDPSGSSGPIPSFSP